MNWLNVYFHISQVVYMCIAICLQLCVLWPRMQAYKVEKGSKQEIIIVSNVTVLHTNLTLVQVNVPFLFLLMDSTLSF